ncbi:uncharacterized protein BDZ99DRAFT_509918 [Mytilinidion resinicola]|uniref:Copper homeostasis protein cutC homolog n=1 Tax=Mytilinidion resinicola TaxID=574789 RepID=A0A6A6YGP1_9PEZI|nr:uncharacterized protein BDZ99DRAFT_509918 [Mytilinidion resinicola]KAF2807748.1 hypothetical protein BDZ99DRAFT_509918 [Mytilinidion resinicola]
MSHLELACFTPTSALTAQSAGASRIELCTSYPAGGLTPPHSTLLALKSNPFITIPIFVMIRPRAGDFVYSAPEFAQMRDEIAAFKALERGPDGFVFGILTSEGRVDAERCGELVRLAGGASCTFHRAIDEVRDLWEGVEAVVECGFQAVLTAGRGGDAVGGVEVLEEIKRRVKGRLEVVVGGGVRRGNIGGLRGRVGEGWYHSAAIMGQGEEADGGERDLSGLSRSSFHSA